MIMIYLGLHIFSSSLTFSLNLYFSQLCEKCVYNQKMRNTCEFPNIGLRTQFGEECELEACHAVVCAVHLLKDGEVMNPNRNHPMLLNELYKWTKCHLDQPR